MPSTPHVGVSCLAAYVRAFGHDPHILDLRVERLAGVALKRRLDRLAPHYVAVTSTSFRYREVYQLIARISAWGWPVLYGGPHVSTVREEVFDGCQPVAAIYGEGEKPLADILAGQSLETVAGIIFRNVVGEIVVNPPPESIADLDSLPFPAYELSPMDLYGERKIPLVTSRGCPCHCIYCCANHVMAKGFRARSPENVVAEIEEWYHRGYRFFGINDDNFTADIDRASAICDILIEKKLDIAWELRTGVRIDRVNELLLRRMKSAGCVFLAFGIEAIDDTVLKLAKKGINFQQIERAVTAAERVGIPFSGFFMIGLPGDTYEKFQNLYRFALNHAFDEVRFYNLEPYPRTEVYGWVQTHGKWMRRPEDYLNDSDMLRNQSLFETENFSFSERTLATEKGEYLMVKKLLEKTLGKGPGAIASFFVRQKQLRALVLHTGFRLAPLIRQIHLRRATVCPENGNG